MEGAFNIALPVIALACAAAVTLGQAKRDASSSWWRLLALPVTFPLTWISKHPIVGTGLASAAFTVLFRVIVG
ncbi:MAG TPA: hypothetical protein VEC35_09265 [Noviherbaspirillum sp.]|nr:hypothetical protein [Noviherbaspirillum sp.]